MSKAEERAQAVYPAWRNGIGDEFSQNSAYYGFIEGYHQAEKDLELGWEDIELIVNIDKDTDNEESIIGVRNNKEHYQEVLKRFKNFKERKDGSKR